MAKVQLTYAEVISLSDSHRVIPLVETLFSGSETPLSIFEKLASDKNGSFLLESAQHGVWARYSFIGVNNRGYLLQESDGQVVWKSDENHAPLSTGSYDLPVLALDAVAAIQESWTTAAIGNLPPLTSGLVGVMGWDLIREIENLPPVAKKDFESPILALCMFRDLVVVDHETNSVLLVSNIFNSQDTDIQSSYDAALANIDAMRRDLLKPSEAVIADVDFDADYSAQHNMRKADFLNAVEHAKEYVRAGDVFQVVISQRFDLPSNATPLDSYRVLRSLNPSPYMYLLNFEDNSGPFAVVGSSPEALVSVTKGVAVTHPIAGSRPRGHSLEAVSYTHLTLPTKRIV